MRTINQVESLALFSRGQAVWNAWAELRLAERRKLKEAGDWTGDSDLHEQDITTLAWHDAATADFSGHKFEGMADFSGFVFPGDAQFNKATFSGEAWLNEAAFKGDALFGKATFSGEAWFSNAAFSGTGFGKAAFKGEGILFLDPTCSGDTEFGEAAFKDNAGFSESVSSAMNSLGQRLARAMRD